MPTRLNNGEGRVDGVAIDMRTRFRSIGVVGTARWKGDAGNRGRPVWIGGCGFNIAVGCGSGRESDRVVGPLRPGNSGGGKAPDFWCAFEDGEEGVIGDEPGNTRQDQEPSEEALL